MVLTAGVIGRDHPEPAMEVVVASLVRQRRCFSQVTLGQCGLPCVQGGVHRIGEPAFPPGPVVGQPRRREQQVGAHQPTARCRLLPGRLLHIGGKVVVGQRARRDPVPQPGLRVVQDVTSPSM